ncbi:hypothetical protein ASG49_04315 [Marmoricola sp. Leaf446]|uniref:hypothetical protein n=1 Tax=Marmoricola sp. Leaf446 TaxID=1736379 RepID=UPI0006FA7FEB|nr:hypothetical protein [Marmoricola sp. Leaf446]KQT94141.1 hypothetical protein ASG49_04315 [Marmoricola sp. Leaf446]
MTLRRTLAALVITPLLATAAACGVSASDGDTAATGTTTASGTTAQDATDSGRGQGGGQGGPGGTDVSSVTTQEQLDALVQEAYGEASLGLHRGHQPIESVLDEVLGITHDELHVRMEEQGQNLAAVAEDLGIDPQTLVDALVELDSPAVDATLAAGNITETQAAAYEDALAEAFSWRISWDGQEQTPTFSGVDA